MGLAVVRGDVSVDYILESGERPVAASLVGLPHRRRPAPDGVPRVLERLQTVLTSSRRLAPWLQTPADMTKSDNRHSYQCPVSSVRDSTQNVIDMAIP